MKKRIEEVVAVELANGMQALETGLVTSVIVYVVAGAVKAVFM
jgi:hypothetical protein